LLRTSGATICSSILKNFKVNILPGEKSFEFVEFLLKTGMLDKIRRWISRHPYGALAIITVAVLLPFLAKPFNIDDPLFLWAAHQIQGHPADPYGFTVQWNGWPQPMYGVTENPPLTSYYIALVASILGWSETALHFAFLLPATAVILGTFRLARYFCGSPLLAALATLFTPVFLISSSTVMCDVPMLAFWIWATVFWIEGTDQNQLYKLFLAGCLAALAESTKYYGVCLIPLLAAYSIATKFPLRRWAPFLLIPLAAFCAFQFVMVKLYGLYILFSAANYRYLPDNVHFPYDASCLMALAFTGGCLATAAFFMPMFFRRRTALFFLMVAAVPAFAVFLDSEWLRLFDAIEVHFHTGSQIQLAFWAAAGLAVLSLSVVDFAAKRDAKSFFLASWVIGTFIFAAFLNWTINGRSILPMAPPLGILIARCLERNFSGVPFPVGKSAIALSLSAAFALYLTEADYLTAAAVRQNVNSMSSVLGPSIKRVWFEGHWGFQFYLSQLGARPVDLRGTTLRSGDLLAISMNNYTTHMPPRGAQLMGTFSHDGPSGVATVNQALGGCFYASQLGPLPFVFGTTPPEVVLMYSMP
jgi:4-amino-4-deoxy-L-arabinose transferase-like glycosyltransferase